MAKANITVSGNGTGRIEVDGHDLSNAVRGFTLYAGVHQVTELHLDLRVYNQTTVSDTEVRLTIPSDVRDALVALGWTPPKGG